MTERGRDPRPNQEVWWEGLKSVQAALMQIHRFQEAFSEWVRAEADAETRARAAGDPPDDPWRQHYDAMEPYDPDRPLRVPSWALRMQASSELDFLLVAIRGVLRAQETIPEAIRPEMADQQMLKHMRDVAEHFDVVPEAAKRLANQFPTVNTGQVAWTTKEIWIGGLEGVPLSRVQSWLWRVHEALVTCLAGVGIDVPDDLLASYVDGDDALNWPSERLRFHWSLPTMDERDWPREPMPETLQALLAQRWATHRTRDPKD